MIVVVANELPDAIRGKMKLWFIEIKPYVFVSGANDQGADNVIRYLFSKSSFLSGMTILKSKNSCPGYEIISLGTPTKRKIKISGLELILSTAKI